MTRMKLSQGLGVAPLNNCPTLWDTNPYRQRVRSKKATFDARVYSPGKMTQSDKKSSQIERTSNRRECRSANETLVTPKRCAGIHSKARRSLKQEHPEEAVEENIRVSHGGC